MQIAPTELTGPTLQLLPLGPELVEPVTAAALACPEVWRFIPYRMHTAADVKQVLAYAMSQQGTWLSHVTCARGSTEVLGGTSIRLVDAQVPSVEIGGTWLLPRWQRTHVNTEAKWLQLKHCFEVLGCARVEFKTDALNQRSAAALLRIGATFEGTFRAHLRRPDGTLRDSAYYSILRSEWPEVQQRLLARLGASSVLLAQ